MDSARRLIIISLIVVSGWVFVSPWVVTDASTAPTSWNFNVAGALSLILGIVALMRSDDLPEYGLIAIAGWLVISPWILNLSEMVTRQSIMYGVVMGGLAWIGRPSHKPKPAAA
jgi:hypothetical protein